MEAKTEGRHAAEFIVSEANGARSRETITLKKSTKIEAGAVLALLTGGDDAGKYVALAASGSNGEKTAGAVLYAAADASEGDVDAAAIVRDAEVDGGALTYASSADISGLADNGIVVR